MHVIIKAFRALRSRTVQMAGCALSGFMVGTSYIPFPPWALFFCLIPLFIFWHRQSSIKASLLGGLVAGFTLGLSGFNWVAYVAHEFGGLNWALSLAVLFIFCCGGNIYFAVAGGLYQFLCRYSSPSIKARPYLSTLLMALLFALLEQFFVTIFKWNFGYTLLWAGLNSAQLAELIGMQGLSSLIILSQAVVAGWCLSCGPQAWSFIKYRWAKFRGGEGPAPKLSFKLSPLVGVLLLWLVFEGVGLYLKHRVPAFDAQVRVLMLQANIGNTDKVHARLGQGSSEYIVDKHINLTRQMLEGEQQQGRGVDFVLWPETAYPRNLKKTSRAQNQKLYNLVQQVPVVTGGYAARQVGSQYKSSNALFVLQGEGGQVYNKKHLLVFGEYIPFSDRWPWLRKYIPAADFARGEGAKVIELKTWTQELSADQTNLEEAGKAPEALLLGPFICYEALFAVYVSRIAKLGAQLLINVTNDSWYGDWQEPYQHLVMSLARAIELRRPVLRATNTGFSTVMLATGEQLRTSPLGQEWQHVYTVPYHSKPQNTLFQTYPYVMAYLLGVMLLLCLLIARREKKHGHI